MNEAAYYFADGSEQRGPFSAQQISALNLRPKTLVWREGMSEWQRLDSLAELNVAKQPPEQTSAPSPAAITRPQQIGYHSGYSSAPPTSGFAVASLVLGIIAVSSLCTGHFSM